MRLLFFVGSMHGGGAERVAATLSSAWASRGDHVTLATTFLGDDDCAYTLDPRVERIWLRRELPAGCRLPTPVAKLQAMRRLAARLRPDVVLSFLTNVNVMTLMATRGLGVPVIVSERSHPGASRSASAALRALRRVSYAWASAVTVQTDAGAAALRAVAPGVRRLAVLPNPLPVALAHDPAAGGKADAGSCAAAQGASPPRGAARAGHGRGRLVAMGRLAAVKRFDRLIRAFADLAARHADWDLHLWGEGPARASLERQVAAAGLEQRVFLPGHTAEPWAVLGSADIFALTSEVEGFPNVMLEAMALGRACVAVDCPSGPRELSQDGQDALLVAQDDSRALSAALDRLMLDPSLRSALGARARESVWQRYSLDAVLRRWDGLFRSLGVRA